MPETAPPDAAPPDPAGSHAARPYVGSAETALDHALPDTANVDAAPVAAIPASAANKSGTVTAAVCRAFGGPLTLETLRLRAPRGTEVEVTLGAVAICHSDIAFARGAWGGPLPAVYGHEAAGTVTAAGPQAKFGPGESVIVTLIRACGQCAACASGAPVACADPQGPADGPLTTPEGGAVYQAMACGAFAERVVVDGGQLARIPPELAMETACLLSCGVITGIGAVVNSAGLRAGQDVVVIGAGGVGLNAIQGARIAGARRIVAVDLTQAKLDDAAAFGATDGVLADVPAPWQAAMAIMGRGADVVICTVGSAAAYRDVPLYLSARGKVVMVGMPPAGAMAEIEPMALAYSGHRLIGSRMGDTVLARDIPWLVDLYRQGRLKLDELVSRRWRLDQINEAIADTAAGHARRNVIVFDR